MPCCLCTASRDVACDPAVQWEEWPVTVGLGGFGTAPRGLPGQFKCTGSTGGFLGLPKHSLEELGFAASRASGVLRKGALFLHLLLCTNAFSVGNHKE